MNITARDVAAAALSIRRGITVEEYVTSSHRVAVIRGLELDDLPGHLALYLVATGFLRAVSTSLRISEEFLNTTSDAADQTRRAIKVLLGPDNRVESKFKTDQRDPWITEGVGHLALWLSRRSQSLSVRGQVQVVGPLQVEAKGHGMDLAALYIDHPDLGITVGEAKASKSNPTAHVADAASFFSEIDGANPVREVQLRERVQLLRQGLRPDFAGRVTSALWEEHRCYMPLVAYGANDSSFAPLRARKSYRDLSPGSERVLLICLCLESYEQYFDNVANAMRAL